MEPDVCKLFIFFISLSALAGVDKKYKEEEAERKGKITNIKSGINNKEPGRWASKAKSPKKDLVLRMIIGVK